ncbi:MAG TPA: polysaccharide deacetylase family protein [Kofleriaceae bacterium]|nr:polysaccharide deacetylase family protein [Kofleriaceae bacterium]
MLTARQEPLLWAFAIKGAALAFGVAALVALPSPWSVAVPVAVALVTIGFFAYSIAHPRSQYFVPVVHRAETSRRVVALTFDDGPDPIVTARVLDILAAHGARATFFVLGERAALYPDLIRRIHAEGHTIGTHTQHHRMRFHFGSRDYVGREIEDAIGVVSGILSRRPSLFRPPHGVRSPCFAQGWLATSQPTCVTWSARGLDTRPTSADAVVARVEKHLGPGAIIALHDGTGLGGSTDRTATLEALPRLLERCRERGLRCVDLGELEREGALVPGPHAYEAERFPLKAVLPGLLYWPLRGWRTLGVASCFAAFWSGAVLFAWIGLPILALWPGTPVAKMRRSLQALRRCFDAFHGMMHVQRLYHRRATTASARPGGQPATSPVVLVANHPTLCDVTAIVSTFPNVVCLARTEFANNLFMGRLLRICGFVPTGASTIEECEQRLRMGFDVLVFPEGTRSPIEGGLQPFHRGAFEIAIRTGVPIVLLKLSCNPTALSKGLPIWRHPDRMAVLTIEPVEMIQTAGQDSRTLCRAVEKRYHDLLGLPPDSPALEYSRDNTRRTSPHPAS